MEVYTNEQLQVGIKQTLTLVQIPSVNEMIIAMLLINQENTCKVALIDWRGARCHGDGRHLRPTCARAAGNSLFMRRGRHKFARVLITA